MTLYMWEADGKFHGSLEYDSALFDPGTISRFTSCFQTLAMQMASQPNTPLMDLALVAADPVPANAVHKSEHPQSQRFVPVQSHGRRTPFSLLTGFQNFRRRWQAAKGAL
jgi:hypothetical protein